MFGGPALFETTVAATGGTSQDAAVHALVCSSTIIGTMCCRVVASLILLILLFIFLDAVGVAILFVVCLPGARA
jgi:hypothetical protein